MPHVICFLCLSKHLTYSPFNNLCTFAQFHWQLGNWSFLKYPHSFALCKSLLNMLSLFEVSLFTNGLWSFLSLFIPFTSFHPMFKCPYVWKGLSKPKASQTPNTSVCSWLWGFLPVLMPKKKLKVAKHILPLLYWLQPLTHFYINYAVP